MLKSKRFLIISAVVIASSTAPLLFAEQHQHQHHQNAHRSLLGDLPANKLEEIRALENPLPDSPDTVAKGAEIYAGKGGCASCHGPTGGGDGPMAAGLNPPPRNFQEHPTWLHHSQGEIFWVIKHGIPNSTMPSFDGILTDKEIWALLRFLPTLTPAAERGMEAGEHHHHEHGHAESADPHASSKHGHEGQEEHGNMQEHAH
ncbi:c-type cytochrome [Nitrosococcus oceani]|uniref:Cytochrome C n=1 Tax=Nitrosococcus oceani C-27 TaxID=314279 RepID=A0A0E2Z4N7_9GAMM|nr:cytochrome c [Nitrosococcus oceani]EDZ67569.1 hypothetical protein NOC27_896 [Nitrosococcus oceani AFC27]KFI20166.1 cytochrome C [Nitrosococcus oceani C-27]KFI23469.1 cytochrome C [Nitrosococcus oceani]